MVKKGSSSILGTTIEILIYRWIRILDNYFFHINSVRVNLFVFKDDKKFS